MLRLRVAAVLLGMVAVGSSVLMAQEKSPFSRGNSFGVFGEYSNNSSHIFLGESEQRKLLNFGASYSRRLVSSRIVDFQYLIELRPVILESDPLTHTSQSGEVTLGGKPPIPYTYPEQTFPQVLKCEPYTVTYSGTVVGPTPAQSGTYSTTIRQTCGGRKWTFGEGLSPVGIRLNFLSHHRLQPVFTGLGGYMFSTEPIPVAQAGSFNFTFEFGVGLEFYQSQERSRSMLGNRSLRAEYRYHHISNHDTADQNPGIDSGMLQVTYAFGR